MLHLVRPLIVIALYALLLPTVGPLLDHHYVEWQHNHGHVYLGGGPSDGQAAHLHIYERGGSHPHIPAESLDTMPAPEGTAFFTSYDGAGTGLIYAPTGPATESTVFPDAGDGPLLAAYMPQQVLPEGATTAPPRRPPPA